jgi:hypothetical protein
LFQEGSRDESPGRTGPDQDAGRLEKEVKNFEPPLPPLFAFEDCIISPVRPLKENHEVALSDVKTTEDLRNELVQIGDDFRAGKISKPVARTLLRCAEFALASLRVEMDAEHRGRELADRLAAADLRHEVLQIGDDLRSSKISQSGASTLLLQVTLDSLRKKGQGGTETDVASA